MSWERPFVQSLSRAVDAVESRFHVEGQIPCRPELVLRTAPDAPISFPLSRDQASTSLAQLVAATSPSAFGHGNQTIVDPSVRVARELLPINFSVNWCPGPELLEKVRIRLCRRRCCDATEHLEDTAMT